MTYYVLRMSGKRTAYVMGGQVFDVCTKIQTTSGLFTPSSLIRFNTVTGGRYGAVEILSHRATFGHVYRIEYNQDIPMPCS